MSNHAILERLQFRLFLQVYRFAFFDPLCQGESFECQPLVPLSSILYKQKASFLWCRSDPDGAPRRSRLRPGTRSPADCSDADGALPGLYVRGALLAGVLCAPRLTTGDNRGRTATDTRGAYLSFSLLMSVLTRLSALESNQGISLDYLTVKSFRCPSFGMLCSLLPWALVLSGHVFDIFDLLIGILFRLQHELTRLFLHPSSCRSSSFISC